MRKTLLIAGAALGLWAYYVSQQSKGSGGAMYWNEGTTLDWYKLAGFDVSGWADGLQSMGTALGGAVEKLGSGVEEILGGGLKLSEMKKVTGADVAHPNVRAFVAVIRQGEGTAGKDGYRTLFGGAHFYGPDGKPETFDDYADHPRKLVKRTFKNGKTVSSTAAGVGQFLASTWDETARIMGLKDFSPANQDLAVVGRIAARGALDDVKAGRFDAAIKKTAREWASLPGSPYGQPVISMASAQAIYTSAGGAYA